MEPYGPEHVQAELEKLGLGDINIMIFEQSTKTAQQAADAIGTELGSIVKSLCFTVLDEPVVVLTAGDQRVDDRKIAQLYEVGRKKVRIASAEVTLKNTGYAPGGVAPIGHRKPMTIYIDETLGRFDTVYAAAGTATSIFPIGYETLVTVTGGKEIDVVRE